MNKKTIKIKYLGISYYYRRTVWATNIFLFNTKIKICMNTGFKYYIIDLVWVAKNISYLIEFFITKRIWCIESCLRPYTPHIHGHMLAMFWIVLTNLSNGIVLTTYPWIAICLWHIVSIQLGNDIFETLSLHNITCILPHWLPRACPPVICTKEQLIEGILLCLVLWVTAKIYIDCNLKDKKCGKKSQQFLKKKVSKKKQHSRKAMTKYFNFYYRLIYV